jgi:hypothetical protein
VKQCRSGRLRFLCNTVLIYDPWTPSAQTGATVISTFDYLLRFSVSRSLFIWSSKTRTQRVRFPLRGSSELGSASMLTKSLSPVISRLISPNFLFSHCLPALPTSPNCFISGLAVSSVPLMHFGSSWRFCNTSSMKCRIWIRRPLIISFPESATSFSADEGSSNSTDENPLGWPVFLFHAYCRETMTPYDWKARIRSAVAEDQY